MSRKVVNKVDVSLCALHTGIRSMEYMRGIGKQNNGTLAQVKFDDDYLHPVYSKVKDNENLLLIVRDRINFGYFKDMTVEEKLLYIEDNSDKEIWFEHVKGCSIRFIIIKGLFLELPDTDQQLLMSGEFIPIRDVYTMFTKKSGKSSMIFRPSIWVLENYNETTTEIICDEYLHLVTGLKTKTKPPNVRLFPVKLNKSGKMVGFCDDLEPNRGEYKSEMNDEFLNIADWFTPSIYKALLQKCIRVGSLEVTHGSLKFPTIQILLTTFFKLMESSGSFVPDLQLFVSGGESAFKRLGIILLEDTYITPFYQDQSSENIIEILFGAALCYRHYKSGINVFTPSSALLSNVIELCKSGLMSSQCYNYDNCNQKLNDDKNLNKKLSISLIEELRSFSGDILMVKDIVKNNFSRVINKRNYHHPTEMKLSHCLDQHSITDIGHFYFNEMSPNMSFSEKFKVIWETTGQNPRRIDSFCPDILVQQAQENLFFAKSSKSYKSRKQIPLHSGKEIIKCRNLDPSWIAGIIGPMESCIQRTNTLSFVNPNNISEIVTIRKPTRDKAANDLTEEIKLLTDESIKNKISSNWISIREKLIQADFESQYKDGQFVCRNLTKKNKEFDWMDYCNGEYEIKCCEDIEGDCCIKLNSSLPYIIASDGVLSNAINLVENYIEETSINVLLRIAMYFRPISNVIQLRSISRDGKGTYKDVHWTDSYVFQFLQQLCIWMPSVVTTDSTLKFTIHNFLLWQDIRNIVLTKASKHTFLRWKNAVLGDTRTLGKHQQEALDTLIDRVSNGKRGHLIWMEPGQGKTLIVTSFIGYLINQNNMPKFCVYSLPKAAIATIEAEFMKSKLPFHVYKKGKELIKPFVVNLIEHDILRTTIRDELISLSTEMFLVIDEMHLLMNDTQRTSIGIELANVVTDFIAMTGTLIKDNDAKNVIQWLEIVSEFPITEKNYMIGIASLISRKLDLGITANHKLISVQMNNEERMKYETVVDEKFGGKAQSTNTMEAFKLCQEVIYHAIIRRIRDVVHKRKPLFVVAKDTKTQERMESDLKGLNCFLINNSQSINLPPDLPRNDPRNTLDVIITTPRHAAGYTLTKCNLLITGVYFGNQATREQLSGRILRLGQRSKHVDIETYHTGLLSYTQKKYDSAKALAESLRGMIKVGELMGEEEHGVKQVTLEDNKKRLNSDNDLSISMVQKKQRKEIDLPVSTQSIVDNNNVSRVSKEQSTKKSVKLVPTNAVVKPRARAYVIIDDKDD